MGRLVYVREVGAVLTPMCGGMDGTKLVARIERPSLASPANCRRAAATTVEWGEVASEAATAAAWGPAWEAAWEVVWAVASEEVWAVAWVEDWGAMDGRFISPTFVPFLPSSSWRSERPTY